MSRSSTVIEPGLSKPDIESGNLPTDASNGALLGFQIADDPVDGVDEVHTVTLTAAAGGTWTYTIGGHTATGLAHNISNANLQLALRALPSVNGANVDVSGSNGGPFTVAFTGALAGKPVSSPSVSGAGLTGEGADIALVVDPAGVEGSFRGQAGRGAILQRTDEGGVYVNTGTVYKQDWDLLAFD